MAICVLWMGLVPCSRAVLTLVALRALLVTFISPQASRAALSLLSLCPELRRVRLMPSSLGPGSEWKLYEDQLEQTVQYELAVCLHISLSHQDREGLNDVI